MHEGGPKWVGVCALSRVTVLLLTLGASVDLLYAERCLYLYVVYSY